LLKSLQPKPTEKIEPKVKAIVWNKLKEGRFRLDIRKKLFTMSTES